MDKVAQYRMWMKSKSSNKSHFEASSEAFGALIWPRRSYNCSFCRREFKSAQGLGGHMNVHRRERARLNNQLSPRPSSHDQSMVSSRVSAPSSTLENYMVSSIIKEHSKVPLFSSPPLSWSDSITTRDFSISDSIMDGEDSSLKPYSEVQNEGDEQSIPFFLIPCSFSRNHQSSETVGLSRGTIEDLDLELRLGDRPKVK